VKFLYVAPEHVSGGFDLFTKGHRQRGNECRYITFFRNKFGFKEDLCFDLHFMANKSLVERFRRNLEKIHNIDDVVDLPGNPPVWKPVSHLAALLFQIRDSLNSPRIRRAINRWELNDYDVYHFEQGIDPYRDGRWIKDLAERSKGIVCFYHGSDIRNRGVIEAIHRYAQLNLTSEIDLLRRLKGMKYLYLPMDTDKLKPNPRKPDDRIRIGHAARNRKFKGSDTIEAIVKRLMGKYPIDWVMIENVTHEKALQLKAGCDIFIDQITDAGGWGYGASSVEALAFGVATMTRINPEVAAFLGDHPFVSITVENLERELKELIEDEELRKYHAVLSRKWVIKTHGLPAVMDTLYGYYREVGLI